jgi:MFS transporter, DHA1 family, multidrug resistance protein
MNMPLVSRTEPTSPSRKAVLAIVLGQFCFGLLAMTISIPSMQDWAAQFSVSQATVQLSFSLYVVAFGGLQLVFGPLSDRLGRKAVLLTGLALAVVASFLAALAPSMGWLLVARALQGAGAAAGMVVGRALEDVLHHGPERTRVMAFVGMAMGMSPPAATLLGGQLHVLLGWQSNFVVMGLAGALLWLASWRVLPARAAQPPGAEGLGATRAHSLAGVGGGYARLLKEPGFRMMVLLLGCTTAAFYAFLAASPVVLLSYGLGPDRIGFVIMCIPFSYILGNYLISVLARRHAEQWLLLAGQACTLLGVLLLVVFALAGLHTLWAFVLPLMLMGLGHGLLVPPTLSASVSVVPAMAGAASAVTGVAQQGMGALGGYVVGWVPLNGALHMGLVMLAFTVAGALAHGAWTLRPPITRR